MGVAAAICKLESGDDAAGDGAGPGAGQASGGGWPELLQFAAAAAGDANPEARELAFLLLSEMTETVGTHLKSEFVSLSSLFASALNDPEARVQKAAVKGLGLLLSYLADRMEGMRPAKCSTSISSAR